MFKDQNVTKVASRNSVCMFCDCNNSVKVYEIIQALTTFC